VFGIIKSVLGFRQFLLRGMAKVSTEWTLVCLAYNLKRLHRLGAGSAATEGPDILTQSTPRPNPRTQGDPISL
jgi:hypothetical protein